MIRAVLASLLLAGCASSNWTPAADPWVIRADGGGRLVEYEAKRKRLERLGTEVRIVGKCYSACTIFTTLPNACVSKTAKIGFHGASVSIGPIGDDQMARHYRGEVKRRYLAEWRHLKGSDLHVITGAQLKRLDPKIKICEG